MKGMLIKNSLINDVKERFSNFKKISEIKKRNFHLYLITL